MTRTRLVMVHAILAVALLVAACTTAGPAPAQVGQGSGEQAASTGSTTEGAADGVRRVVVAQGSGVESWDPPAGWGTASEWIEMHVYDCLVFADRETGNITGWLAESWENVDEVTWR